MVSKDSFFKHLDNITDMLIFTLFCMLLSEV